MMYGIDYFCPAMKKSIYILAPYPHGQAPSQRFRFEQYLDFLKEHEFEIYFHPFLDEKTWNTLYKPGNALKKVGGFLISFLRRWKLLFTLRKADFIFIHREAAQIGPPVFEWIIAKVLRKKYIYDFDDAIWLPNYSASNAKFHRLKAYWKVKYCIQWAHQVSAGNQYLSNYAQQYNSNVSIVPTTIDTVNHHNLLTNYEKEDVIIGWTGTHTTMHYLDDLIPILKELEQHFTFQFLVISNEPPQYDLKSLRFKPWSKATEIQDLAEISIGVMPLREDIWSAGKCGFKGLQYMALGIPSVLSPIGVNNEIISHEENGFLAHSPEEWKTTLEKLIQSAELRKKIGLHGRTTILNHYSVKSQENNYLSFFK